MKSFFIFVQTFTQAACQSTTAVRLHHSQQNTSPILVPQNVLSTSHTTSSPQNWTPPLLSTLLKTPSWWCRVSQACYPTSDARLQHEFCGLWQERLWQINGLLFQAELKALKIQERRANPDPLLVTKVTSSMISEKSQEMDGIEPYRSVHDYSFTNNPSAWYSEKAGGANMCASLSCSF